MLRIQIPLILLIFTSIAQADSIQQLKSELETEQFSRAAATGLTLLRKQPENLQLQFMTALAFQKNNQQKQAVRYYQEIIKAHPELPEPRNNLAIIYLQQGKSEEAVQLLVDSLNTHQAYATAWKNLNSIYQGLASEAYRKALNENVEADSLLHKIQLTELDQLHQIAIADAKALPAQPSASTPPRIVEPAAVVATVAEPVSNSITTPSAAPAVSAQLIPQPEPPETPDNQQLIQVIQDWGDAWSEQRFEQYVSAYTDSYRGRYPSHDEWVKQRRKRVVRAQKVKLTLTQFRIKSSSAELAVIDFHQAYQSEKYSDRVVKRVHLTRINNSWKISREVTLAVL